MQEEYTENLEKLFLSGKKTSAQNFFCVEKFGSKERKALNFFLKHEYLYGSNEGGKKCYLMGKAGFLFLQGNFYRWEYLQQKLTEKQKQFEIKIFPFLEKMFFFDKKIEIKELFAKEKITMKHISFWKDALDDDYISIETENNKKKYILTKKSLDLLQEDNENYKKLLKDKALQKKKTMGIFFKAYPFVSW